jgi:predicted Fe-Mo cluster-binding NifX family protein
MMKIAVSSTGPNFDDIVEARFGRCPYFLIVDPATMEVEALPNPSVDLGGGAGIQSAKFLTEKGVSVLLTGNCGPNAAQMLETAGIRIVTGVSGSARQAVHQFTDGSLKTTSAARAEGPFGQGAGRGMGRGIGGGGRGMGGRGMGGSGRGMGGGRRTR